MKDINNANIGKEREVIEVIPTHVPAPEYPMPPSPLEPSPEPVPVPGPDRELEPV